MAIAWVQLAAQIESKSTGAKFLGVVLPSRMTGDDSRPAVGAVYENLRLASVCGATDSYSLHDIMLLTYDVSAALATLHELNGAYGRLALEHVLVEEKPRRARRFHLSELASTGYDHARAVTAAAAIARSCPRHALRFAMRQDVHGVGVLIWKMITRAGHVDHVDEHTPFTMHPVYARYGEQTCDLIELARKCLRREPSSRPSADAVRHEVHALLNNLDEVLRTAERRSTQTRRKRTHVAARPSVRRRVMLRVSTTSADEAEPRCTVDTDAREPPPPGRGPDSTAPTAVMLAKGDCDEEEHPLLVDE